MPKNRQHPYERELEVSHVWLDYPLTPLGEIAWDDYLLNPRQLRGSDFLMRWAQGVWSEHRMLQAMNENGVYLCVEYGPSGVAPEGDPRAFELYFERLEHAGLGDVKRPDLMIFNRSDSNRVSEIIESLGGAKELPFIPESEPQMKELLALAIMGIECENSLWKAAQMPDFGSELRPQKRLGGKLGLAKSAVLPTVIVKDQDLKPLQQWQSSTGVPIHVWHSFYDRAYGLSLSKLEQLIAGGLIEPTVQVFQAPGGATTKKAIYKIYYHYAYELGTTIEEPQLVADSITDKNGHIMPYVRFFGGKMKILQSAIDEVDAENRAKK